MIDIASLQINRKDRLYVILGIITISIVVLFKFQLFFKLVAFLIGLLLVLRGLSSPISQIFGKIDQNLRPYMAYRIFYRILSFTLRAAKFVLFVIFSGLVGRLPQKSESFVDQKDCTVDDIWNKHSTQYNDTEPPRPFS